MIEKDELIAVLERMSRERFQRLAMDLLDTMGFETHSARSFGSDFEAEAEMRRGQTTLDYVIRITRSGGDPEKEISGLKNALGPGVRGLYITTSDIQEDVKHEENVEVAGAQELYDLMKEYDILAEFDEADEGRSLPSATELGRLMDWASEFREKHNYPKAIEYYNKAISLKPDSYKPRIKKAEVLIEQGEHQEARDELKEFMEVGTEVPEVWITLGKAYHEAGMFDEEIESYDRALDINEDHVGAWNLKGATLYEQGLYEEANLCFERVLEVEPKDVGAWNNKGLCLFKMEDLPQALNALNNALTIEPDYEDALINKALVLENQNKIPKALQVAHELTSLRPRKPEFHYIKAAYQEAVGEVGGALDSVDTALRLRPDYEQAIRLKERLGKRQGETPSPVEPPIRLEKEELEEDRDYILKKIHALERDINDLKSIKHTVDDRISTTPETPEVHTELEEKDDEIDHLRGEKARLEKELSKIWQRRLEDEGREEDIGKLAKEKDILERELEKRETDLREMEETKEMLEEDLRRLREGGEELSQQQEKELVRAIKEREDKLELLTKDKEEMAEELQQSSERIKDLQSKINSLEEQIEMHREEVKKRDEIIDDIKSKEELIDALSKEKDKLHENLIDSSSKIERLKEEKQLLQDEVHGLRREREHRELRRRETHQRMKRIREVEAKENMGFIKRAAELLFKMGENEKVIELTSDRGEDRLLNILGCALYETRQIGRAVNFFRDAPDAIGRYNQEEVSYEMGQYRNATKTAEEIILHFSDSSVFWERRGEAYRRLGILDKAIYSYDSASAKVGEDMGSFLMARARCTAEEKGRPAAIEELERRLDTKDDPAHHNLCSSFLYMERNYDDAIKGFRKSAEFGEGVHYNNLGCSAYQLERYGEALSALEKAVEVEPDNVAFINNLGFCQLERDLTEAAKNNFRTAIEIDEEDPVGWYNMGIVMKRLGEEGWEEYIQKSLDLAPGFEQAKKMLEI